MIGRVGEIVSHYFEDKTEVLAVWALGSVITGNFRPESDIDLAVLLKNGKRVSVSDRMQWTRDLSYELARTVDLGEIHSASLTYSREALLKGKLLFVRDLAEMSSIRISILGMYLQYNLDRREVLNAFSKG